MVFGSARPALLPEVALALELPAPCQAVALELAPPEATLRALAAESALAHAVLPRAVPKRRAEFAAGRHAAALALARFGCFDAIGRAASGAPLWPAGFAGSISHGAGLAAAVVARASELAGLGFDIERSISEEQRAEIALRILNEAELERLAAALPSHTAAQQLSLGFSAKESLYKCLNPLLGTFFDFDAASVLGVQPQSPSSGRITLALTRDLSADFQAGLALEGRYAYALDRIETAVWLPIQSLGKAK